MDEAGRFEATTTIDELLAEHPRTVGVFHRHGMRCPVCVLGRFTTIAEACETYHQQLDGFLVELRSVDRRESFDGEPH